MRNFIFGAIAGLAIGILGARLVLSPDLETQSNSTRENAGNDIAQSSVPSDVDPRSSADEKALANRASQVSSPTTTESVGQTEQLDMPRSNNAQSDQSSNQRNRVDLPAGTQSIALTDAHRDFLAPTPENKGASLERHLAVEAQPRDDNWANYMEQLLNGFFASRAPRVGVEIANIVCRESLCEIQAFSSERASVAFGTLPTAAEKEPWWDFAHVQALSGTSQNREVVIVFLDRSKTPAQRAPAKLT